MSQAQGMIFDCDGTLVDSIGVWWQLNAAVANATSHEFTQEEIEHIVTLAVPESARFFHESFGFCESTQAAIQYMDDFLLDFYSNRATLKPGVEEFLNILQEASIPSCVVSASPQRYLQACFEGLGMTDVFKCIISVEDLHSSKREPKVYFHAASLLGTDIDRTWGFEDALYACKTLYNAGFPTVGIFGGRESGNFDDMNACTHVMIESFEGLSLQQLQR